MFLQRSPECIVRVLGLESTTWTMARYGWEFAFHGPAAFESFGPETMMMRHPKSSICIVARLVRGSLREAAFHSDVRPLERPVFEAYKLLDDKCIVETVPSLDFTRVDVSEGWPQASVAMSRGEMRAISSLGFFKKWEDEVEEIIVDQASVSELMDRIRKLQEPELTAIRERNRRREQRSANEVVERVSAQIISIAA